MSELADRSILRPVVTGAVVAAIQVLAIVAVTLVWRHSSGSWGSGAWGVYLIGFGVVAPSLGALVARRLGLRGAGSARILVRVVVVVAGCNALFAMYAHGFEDAGVPMATYVLGYAALLWAVIAAVSRK